MCYILINQQVLTQGEDRGKKKEALLYGADNLIKGTK
jgi:hypothetical protein